MSGNRVVFTVEFDFDAWESMTEEERARWVDSATDALAGYCAVVGVSA